MLPHRAVPLEEPLAAPDVVHQHVEAPLLGVDPPDQRLHLRRHQVVRDHGDALPARRRDQLRRLLDGLRPVVLRPAAARTAARHVHRRALRAQLDRDAPARAPRGPGHQGDLAFEGPPCFRHGPTLRGEGRPGTQARTRAAGRIGGLSGTSFGGIRLTRRTPSRTRETPDR